MSKGYVLVLASSQLIGYQLSGDFVPGITKSAGFQPEPLLIAIVIAIVIAHRSP